MSYRASVEDIAFSLKHAAGFGAGSAQGLFDEPGEDVVHAVLAEAGRFATEILSPLNRTGDRQGVQFKDGIVTMPPGWKEAYRAWSAGGWNSVSAPAQWGGQALPRAVNAACIEMWNSAAMAFAVAPVLTMAAVDALAVHGTDELRRVYLPKLVSGEWMGTMQLTEPQAGSDVGLLRTRAERAADGSYRLTGQKIFITYGEHNLTDNIVHMVLARLPDGAPGTRGLSLFLVPKFLPNPDGSPGRRNDVRAASIEQKLGIHASPTCTMVFGDEGSGAVGYLVGEEHRGMTCMFTMMNQARLAIGLQGVGIAEAAAQQALAYARERRQGGSANGGPKPIIAHPDVKRMLLTMRAFTRAARAICYATAAALDHAERLSDPEARAAVQARAALLTPIAKAFATDIANEVASLGIQVHGGMGYIEETGAAQYYRDARIAAIYEGTNGIQAVDLVSRKVPGDEGVGVKSYIRDLKKAVAAAAAANDPAFGAMPACLDDAVASLERATDWLIENAGSEAALAGATPYLRLFAYAAGGAMLASEALAAIRSGGSSAAPGRVAIARFFAENIATTAKGLEDAVTTGSGSIVGPNPALE